MINDLKAKDEKKRANAAKSLGKLGNKKAVKSLINILEDEYAEVRIAAAEALGNLGSSKAVGPIVKYLRDFKLYDEEPYEVHGKEKIKFRNKSIEKKLNFEKNVRRTYIEALGKIGGSGAAEHMIKIIQGARGSYDDINALTNAFIKVIGNNDALNEPLMKILEQSIIEKNPYALGEAAGARGAITADLLGSYGRCSALFLLIETIGNDFKLIGNRWYDIDADDVLLIRYRNALKSALKIADSIIFKLDAKDKKFIADEARLLEKLKGKNFIKPILEALAKDFEGIKYETPGLEKLKERLFEIKKKIEDMELDNRAR